MPEVKQIKIDLFMGLLEEILRDRQIDYDATRLATLTIPLKDGTTKNIPLLLNVQPQLQTPLQPTYTRGGRLR